MYTRRGASPRRTVVGRPRSPIMRRTESLKYSPLLTVVPTINGAYVAPTPPT